MINYNGEILVNEAVISIENRGFSYGDALFETIKVSRGKILFWEDHYFRLMASMRIMRMEIPMNFTMEFLENQILETLKANQLLETSSRLKLFVYRINGGLYLPESNDINFVITTNQIENDFYLLNDDFFEIDIFKDYFIAPSLLSTLKTNNKVINVVGSIFAKENKLDNCLLLNTNKNVIEALNGNVFIVKDSYIKTPPLKDGCLKGVMRKQIIEIFELMPEYVIEEASISPFELQKADEIFITNVIKGIQPVTKYRKKVFKNVVSKMLLGKLNMKIRLTN